MNVLSHIIEMDEALRKKGGGGWRAEVGNGNGSAGSYNKWTR